MTSKLTLKAKALSIAAVAITTLFMVALLSANVSAGHNSAEVTYETGECGETTFNASVGNIAVSNMYLIVSANGETELSNIPSGGSAAPVTVGPFENDTTIYYYVFGGGERDYDDPHWTGYGEAGFNAAVSAYGSANGWGWLTAGPDDPNPFVNWYEVPVEGCPPPVEETDEKPAETTKAEAKSDDAPKEKASEQEAVTPVGGVNAGGGGASSTSVASIFGLLASSAAFGFGLLRGFIRIGG